jgi:hypothetical protein
MLICKVKHLYLVISSGNILYLLASFIGSIVTMKRINYPTKSSKQFILMLLTLILSSNRLTAQLYVETVGGVFPLNICDCTFGTPVLTVGTSAISVASDLSLYYLANDELLELSLLTGTSTVVAPVLNPANSMVTATNGIVYVLGVNPLTGTNGLLTSINPITGIVTTIGTLPSGYLPSGDLFFYNGNLYATIEFNGINAIAQIPVLNPSATTIIFNTPNMFGFQGAASLFVNGVETVYVAAYDINTNTEGIFQLNMVTGMATLVCPAMQVFDMGSLTGSSFAGCCTNFAGTFAQTSLVTACQNQPINLIHNNDQQLANGSSLTFILSADSNATLPSGVIQISNTPSFSFNAATMTTNTTYYVAAVAAPLINGVPNWNNMCLDISAFVPVQWQPVPSVSFSVANPSLCAGTCKTLIANFVGTPPFNLSYSTPNGTVSQVFSSNTGTFQVCAPVGSPPASFLVQALSLTDAFCTCN